MTKKAQVVKEILGVNETVAENLVDDLNEAIKDGNVEVAAKIKYLVDQLADLGRPKLQSVIQSNESYILAQSKVTKLVASWKAKIAANDYVDIYSAAEFKWFESKVVSIDHARDSCRVHYIGWQDKYDEDLVLSEKIIYPVYTFTRRKVVAKKKDLTAEPEPNAIHPIATADVITATETIGNVVDALQDRASRRRSRAPETAAAVAAPAPEDAVVAEKEKKAKPEKPEKDLNDWICGICGLLEAADGTDLVLCEATCLRSFHTGCMQRQQMPGPTSDTDTWFCPDCRLATHKCFICHQRGADFQDVFKCNLATCGKHYHRACLENGKGAFIAPPLAVVKKEVMRVIPLGPDEIPPSTVSVTTESTAAATHTTDEASDSTPARGKGRNKAVSTPVEARATRGVKLNYKALSGKNSSSKTDGEEEEEESEMDVVEEKNDKTKMDKDTPDYSGLQPSTHYKLTKVATEGVLNFKCPLHCCFNCFEFYGAKDNTDLNPCIYCPRAFHTKCVVPGSRFNSRCVVCPRHPTEHLPSTDITAKVVTNEYSVFWEQLAIPDVFPDPENVFDNHFKLQKHIQESSSEQPVNFKMIQRNDYDFMQNKTLPVGFVPEVACECKVTCDEHCLNRILRIECCDLKGSRNDNDSGNICNIGAGCTNRALQQRKYAKTEVFREFQMGFGLRVKEPVSDGALIMEYVGEVIDLAEVHRRMTSQRELTPSDRDFYIMELDNGLFVDGKHRGSNSRFINHSCDPNCELQRWVVKGSPRIGIFAVRDILPGEALSYDYQFDTNESEAFKCYCGTAKCRGTMAPTKKNKNRFDANGRPQSRDERLKLISLGKEKLETENTWENMVEAEWSRSYTGRFLPGDVLNEMKNGPVRAALLAGQSRGVLLCRVVKKGSNFFDRKQLLIKRGPRVRKALYLAEQRDREQQQSNKRPRRAASKGRGGKGKKNSARQSTEDSEGESEQGDDVGLDLEA